MNKIKYNLKSIIKICILATIFIALNTVVSNAAIHTNDPTATTNSTVSITVASTSALDNFNMDVISSGGLTFSSVSTKGITNGTAVGYMTLTDPLTTLGTYTFKTPSNPGEYKVTFSVNGQTNVSTVKVAATNNISNDNNSSNDNKKSEDITATTSNEKSNNANLSNLGIRPNDFSGFSATKTSYSVTVPNDVETVEVYATKGHSGQTVTGTGSKKLNVGANTASVVVTAEDGKTTKTYTINITRSEDKKQDEEDKEKTDDSEVEETEETEDTDKVNFGLTKLSVAKFNMQPEFRPDVYEYKIQVTEDIDKLNISTLTTEDDALVEILGNENLQEGENVITVIVKSKDEEQTIAYQIIVNKVLTPETTQILSKKQIIIISASALALIFVIIIIVIAVKKKKNNHEEEYIYTNLMSGLNDDTDDVEKVDDGNNYYEVEQPKRKKRAKGKRYK